MILIRALNTFLNLILKLLIRSFFIYTFTLLSFYYFYFTETHAMKRKTIVLLVLLTIISSLTSYYLSKIITQDNSYSIYFSFYIVLFISLAIESWHWRFSTKSALRNKNYFFLYSILLIGIIFYFLRSY